MGSIKTTVPSNLRRPGTFAEFDITSKARGLVPLTQRVALLGTKLTAGTQAVLTPIQCFTEADGDNYFGKGSELALMVRAALAAAAFMGSSPQIWAVAITDPGGAKATRTLTVTGPATAAGDVVFRVAGRTLRAPVANGATAIQVAAAIRDAILAKPETLPVTAAVGSNPNEHVVTATANHFGVNGNDIKVVMDSMPTGISIVVANGASGTGTYDITAALDVLVDKRYDAKAIANHTSTDVTDFKAHIDVVNDKAAKLWTMCYLAETGTLSAGTTLSAASNYKDVVVVTAEGFPNLPGEIAATYATTVESVSDPAHNFDGQELPLFVPAAADVPTNSEIETALAAGAAILSVNGTNDRARIVRFVTTKTTEASVAFENLLDGSNVRSLFYTAAQVDAKVALVLKGAKKTARTKKRLKSVVLDVLRKEEELEILQNVEAHIGELQVEDDSIVPTRCNIAIPASVVPNLHQAAQVFTLYVE